jgi:hypothetical protein
MPQRIQRQRTKGWRMPAGAVYVGRPTNFGNPWKAGGPVDFGGHHPVGTEVWFGRKAGDTVLDPADAVALYRLWLHDCAQRGVPHPIAALRGRDLVCWCPPGQPCHADVLLELANR